MECWNYYGDGELTELWNWWHKINTNQRNPTKKNACMLNSNWRCVWKMVVWLCQILIIQFNGDSRAASTKKPIRCRFRNMKRVNEKRETSFLSDSLTETSFTPLKKIKNYYTQCEKISTRLRDSLASWWLYLYAGNACNTDIQNTWKISFNIDPKKVQTELSLSLKKTQFAHARASVCT